MGKIAGLLAWIGFLLTGGLPTVLAEDSQSVANSPPRVLEWSSLPDLPDALGVAGPFVGVHKNALIVAGGANFPEPVWENEKAWRDRIHVLVQEQGQYHWIEGGVLPFPLAYGAAVSTDEGIVCMGGNTADETRADVFLLKWNPETRRIERETYPPLPTPCAYGQAVRLGDRIYLAGGQSGSTLDSAMRNFWVLDLKQRLHPENFRWQTLDAWPGPSRAFNITARQHNGYDDCIYVLSGRRQGTGEVEFLQDTWEYTPRTGIWRQRRDVPRYVMAGTGIEIGQSHLLILGGADGTLFHRSDELRDAHPGFPRTALAYHTITDTWTTAGEMPANHVTTIPVRWGERIILASGEIRPRVRTARIWSVTAVGHRSGFVLVDYALLVGYLLGMVGIGIYFARRNRNTEDYFRGGMHIPWWAAGCSIFATMLSSLTFTGIPSKAFAQDWTYLLGNLMIPLVAFVGVYLALPFYRRIDATSAYEYLEKRFHRGVRLFGSASFTLFHLFRMAVVMSLTGLALAVATPLTPTQAVLLMGMLSIIYCTLGGIEAVIWTDTIQTFILLGGALLALYVLVQGTAGGAEGLFASASQADKLRLANLFWDPFSTQAALWVIVIGGIGQNVASYTADQAVVQRYMTTPSEKLAARAIWTNALLTIPATFLFFGIGTALFAYYQSHPGRLDPTITTDQIFPLFIASEMPPGIAGLIVAGLFSAAQSTVSTSMNSTATTIVTDFLRPCGVFRDEQGPLRAARFITFGMGTAGTLLALWFIQPEIRSLFDAFIKVIGLFMGVLGGLFLLGALTNRANTLGAATGACAGTAFMYWLWRSTSINGFLYTASGIAMCYVCGYLTSLASGGPRTAPLGLTIHSIRQAPPRNPVE